jgi:IS5 family transposase
MHQGRKGNQWHFGMQAHIGVDADLGLVHNVVGICAVEFMDGAKNVVERHDGMSPFGYSAYAKYPVKKRARGAERGE